MKFDPYIKVNQRLPDEEVAKDYELYLITVVSRLYNNQIIDENKKSFVQQWFGRIIHGKVR